jgi:heme-degrading monooxygenase HmoA
MTAMTGERNEIVRTWSATATGEGAEAYRSYFAGTLLPQLRDRPGFVGGYLLARSRDGVVELTTHTIWASLDAIRAFAGAEIAASVVEPEARMALLDYDRSVTHRNVLVAVP